MINKEDFRFVRWTKRTSLYISLALCLTLLLGINYIFSQRYIRKDITEYRYHSLSPESLAYIKQIDTPIDIYVTIPPASRQPETSSIYKHITNILKEYAYASRLNQNGKIAIHLVNPYEQSKKSQEIANRFGVIKENAIIFSSEYNHREVYACDLYTFKTGEISGFKGEQIFTSALLDVANPEQEAVYFLVGHGEMRMNDVDSLRGISQAANLLLSLNFKVEQLDLSEFPNVPEDSSLVILAAPQAPMLPHEIDKLKRYLNEKNGRLLAFLEPTKRHGLDDLLKEWGIITDDMIILDTGKDFQTNGGDLIIRRYTKHPVTQFLIDYQLTVLTGLSRPVRPHPEAPNDDRRSVIPLLESSPTSWAESDYSHYEELQYNLEYDLPGPVPIGTLSERRVNSALGINIPGSRLIVFGNSDFISNNRFNALGNKMLFQNIVNWAVDKNEVLSIPPRNIEKFQLTLSRSEFLRLATSFSALPAAIGLLGLIIYSFRKR